MFLASVHLACAGSDTASDAPTVREMFITGAERFSNMDSPAVWLGAGGEEWLIATGKWTNRLYVYDAGTGELVRTVGGSGTAPGEFRRPNGIAVSHDHVFVVERDNARVQVLRLPDFRHVAMMGERILREPYGIALGEHGPSSIDVFVTDDYGQLLGRTPPDRELGERVKRFRFELGGGGAAGTYIGVFGDTAGAGRLRKVESVALDTAAGVVLIADEEAGDVKVYSMNGEFTGRVLWGDLIRHEPEGIALYRCGAGGWWIVADQHTSDNRFLIFERDNFRPIGAFTGTIVRNTDGIALTEQAVGSMTGGALYAVHDDHAIGAFPWRDIAATLGLSDDCAAASER